LGYLNQGMIARLERDERSVTLTVAYGCEVIFGVSPEELFPAALESVEARILARMHELRDQIGRSAPSQKAIAKRKLLDEAIARVTALQVQEV
jgi:transcriptional regulator with XRE-family HTH domain